MPLFGGTTADCPLAKLKVKLVLDPDPGDGSTVKAPITLVKTDDPKQGKRFAGKGTSGTFKEFKKLPPGNYQIKASPTKKTLYYFLDADTVNLAVAKRTPPQEVELKIRPVVIDLMTPTPVNPVKDLRQYVNLELTDEDRKAGKQLVPHDVALVRARAAKTLATQAQTASQQEVTDAELADQNDPGKADKELAVVVARKKHAANVKWVQETTALENAAAGRGMEESQMGRLVKVEARVSSRAKGLKVFFAVEPDPNNPVRANVPAKFLHKLKAASATTDAQGIARTELTVSRFGGDKFVVKASLYANPLTNGKAKPTRTIACWRKIWYQVSYNADSTVPALDRANTDFAGLFVESEPIDTRPYSAATLGVVSSDSWLMDQGLPSDVLFPGKEKAFDVVILPDATLEGLPTSALAGFKDKTSNTQYRVKVRLGKPTNLDVTGSDFAPAEKVVGGPFTPLHKTFRLKNLGDKPAEMTVSRTQDWLILPFPKIELKSAANKACKVKLDPRRIALLGVGTHTDTVTFAGNGQNFTKTVTVKVKANPAGVLSVRPPEDLHALGSVGGPFAPLSKVYTIKNDGGAELEFSAAGSNVDWLSVTYPAKTALEETAKEKADAAKVAKEKAEALALEATPLKEEAAKLAKTLEETKEAGAERIKQAETVYTPLKEQAEKLGKELEKARQEQTQTVEEHRAKVEGLEKDVAEAEQAHSQQQKLADEVKQRAQTPQAGGQAQQEQESADELKEKLDTLKEKLETAKKAQTEAVQAAQTKVDKASSAHTQAVEKAETEASKLETARQEEAEKERVASEAHESAKEKAEAKQTEADKAKEEQTKADEEALEAKNLAKAGKAKLASGASHAVTVQIDATKANSLGALPGAEDISFHNHTAGSSVLRQVLLAPDGHLTVTGGNFEETAEAGQFGALSKTYRLENDGGLPLDYELTTDKAWVVLGRTYGTLAAGAHKDIQVSVAQLTANAFAQGEQTANLHVRDVTHNVTTDLEVKLTVNAHAGGVYALTPNQDVWVLGAAGGPFAPQKFTLTVKNNGGAPIRFRANKSEDWLTISSPGEVLCVGDHNKETLKQLRMQPADQRPQTVHLVMCDQQWDPTVSILHDEQSASRSIAIEAKYRSGGNNKTMGIFKPTVEGLPLVKKGNWTWDGHKGTVSDADVKVEQGRAWTDDFTVTIPAQCPNTCPKAGCGGGTAVNPTNAKKVRLKIRVRGAMGPYLGEGGSEASPSCLIVIENDFNSFNDTVSHEIGHMYNCVLRPLAKHDARTTELKEYLKDAKTDLKSLSKTDPDYPGQQAYIERLKKRIANAAQDKAFYWHAGHPVHATQYVGMGGQGSHCSKDATLNNTDPTDPEWDDGSCVLYHSGRPVKLNWCVECQKIWKFIDMRRFGW